MIYNIVHRTICKYRYTVSVGKHVACLRPRHLPGQELIQTELLIEPSPAIVTERTDYFGNLHYYFTIQEPHRELVVEARNEVRVHQSPSIFPKASMSWEEAVKHLANDQSVAGLDAFQFRFESPRIKPQSEYAAYALRSFLPGRPLREALLDLTSRIYSDFKFDSKVTNVRTTTEEVFRKRRGVCQDFAHLQIACLRSLNLAARYVSGYIRTYPPPGKPKLVGADASHAWLSAFCPGEGWLDLDPTNNVVPHGDHVIIGWGRDYGDVSPLHGLIVGGGTNDLTVAVDMDASS